jgi:hypothetical protein
MFLASVARSFSLDDPAKIGCLMIVEFWPAARGKTIIGTARARTQQADSGVWPGLRRLPRADETKIGTATGRPRDPAEPGTALEAGRQRRMAGPEAGAEETARRNHAYVCPTPCGRGVSSTRRLAGKCAAGSGVVDFVAVWPTGSGFARSPGRLVAHLPLLPAESRSVLVFFRRIFCTNLLLSPFTFNYHSIFGTPELRTIGKRWDVQKTRR